MKPLKQVAEMTWIWGMNKLFVQMKKWCAIFLLLIGCPFEGSSQSKLDLDGYANYSFLGNLEFDIVQKNVFWKDKSLGLHVGWGAGIILPPVTLLMILGEFSLFPRKISTTLNLIPFEAGITAKTNSPRYFNLKANLTYSIINPGYNPLQKYYSGIRLAICPTFGKKRLKYGFKISGGYFITENFTNETQWPRHWWGISPFFLSYKLNK